MSKSTFGFSLAPPATGTSSKTVHRGTGTGSAASGSGTGSAPPSIFSGAAFDGDDDDGVLGRGKPSLNVFTAVDREKRAALLRADPSVFSYDEVVEEREERKSAAKRPALDVNHAQSVGLVYDGGLAERQSEKRRRQTTEGVDSGAEESGEAADRCGPRRASRYVAGLQRTAVRRKIEQEAIEERLLKKQRDREDDGETGEEVFVTGAYKRQLAERKRVQEELDAQDAKDEAKAAHKQTDLTQFHRALLDQRGRVGPQTSGPQTSGPQSSGQATGLAAKAEVVEKAEARHVKNED
eukprot:Selendium_serpulae@DN6086_c11_g1_i1.p2